MSSWRLGVWVALALLYYTPILVVTMQGVAPLTGGAPLYEARVYYYKVEVESWITDELSFRYSGLAGLVIGASMVLSALASLTGSRGLAGLALVATILGGLIVAYNTLDIVKSVKEAVASDELRLTSYTVDPGLGAMGYLVLLGSLAAGVKSGGGERREAWTRW